MSFLFAILHISTFVCWLERPSFHMFSCMQELALPWPCFVHAPHAAPFLNSLFFFDTRRSPAGSKDPPASQPPQGQLWQRNASEALRLFVKINRSFQRKVLRTTLGFLGGELQINMPGLSVPKCEIGKKHLSHRCETMTSIYVREAFEIAP